MQNVSMIYGYARVSTTAQDESGQVRQLKAVGCEKGFREKITGTTAVRPQLAALMKKLAPGDIVITPAVDRLSRDTTDLLVVARDMQRAGAGIRSLAERFLDTTSDFAEIIFAILGVAAPPHSGAHGARPGRRQSEWRQIRPQADPNAAPAERGPAAPCLPVRGSAALPGATTSVRARFHGWQCDRSIHDFLRRSIQRCTLEMALTNIPLGEITEAAWLRDRPARQVPAVGRHGLGRDDGLLDRPGKRRTEADRPLPDGHAAELDRDRRSEVARSGGPRVRIHLPPAASLSQR